MREFIFEMNDEVSNQQIAARTTHHVAIIQPDHHNAIIQHDRAYRDHPTRTPTDCAPVKIFVHKITVACRGLPLMIARSYRRPTMSKLFLAAVVLFSLPALASIDSYPSMIRFRDTPVGQRSSNEQIRVTNRGPKDVRSIFVSGSCGGSFNVLATTCFGTLRSNQTCYVNAAFTPNREGPQSCTVVITGDGSSDTVNLSGRGLPRRLRPNTQANTQPDTVARPDIQTDSTSPVDAQTDQTGRTDRTTPDAQPPQTR